MSASDLRGRRNYPEGFFKNEQRTSAFPLVWNTGTIQIKKESKGCHSLGKPSLQHCDMKQDWCDTCTNTTCPSFFPCRFLHLSFLKCLVVTHHQLLFVNWDWWSKLPTLPLPVCISKSWVSNVVFQSAACKKSTKESTVIQHFQMSHITHMILKHLSCIICRLRRFYEWHCREFVRCVFLSFIIFLSQLLKSRRNRSSRVWKFLLLTKKLLLCVLTLKHFQWHSYQTTYLLLH